MLSYIFYSSIYVVILLGSAHGHVWTDPVTTTQGKVRGLVADDGDYSMYLGIPYAKVDEDNPFGDSKPHRKFDTIFDAIDDTAKCPQAEGGQVVGNLDCLHLNIYVPHTPGPKPVVIWLHGGVFTTGYSGRYVYGPKYLVQHDIVLVSVNYRLGPYGFMCLGTKEVPGNQGFKDQLLAFQWIHNNIAAFSGDADQITLMGESAGGMAIDFHLMSGQPKLYHQAILQSGTGLVPALIFPSNKKLANNIARHLGFDTNDVQEAISFLAKADVSSVISATLNMGLNFRLCIEEDFGDNTRVLVTHPEKVNDISKVRNMNIMAGFNSHELMYIHLAQPFESILETFFYDYIAQDFNMDDLGDMVDRARRFYMADDGIKQELIWEMIDFASDIKFNHPTQRSVEKYIENGANVYQYVFSYSGNRNLLKYNLNLTGGGATHADELGYLFDVSYMSDTPTVADQLMIDRITTMWANFVKYGNPTPAPTNLLPVTWPPAKDVISYLDIDHQLTLGTRPFHARMTFWDLFYTANYDHLKAFNSARIPSSVYILVVICSFLLL